MAHIYNGVSRGHKEEYDLAARQDADGGRAYNAERSQSVRERQVPCKFTHTWKLTNTTNEQRERERNQETDSTENTLLVPSGEGAGVGAGKPATRINAHTCITMERN